MKKLWVHEVMRIYHDRITETDDSNWFMTTLKSVTSIELKQDLNILLQHLLAENETEVLAGIYSGDYGIQFHL